MRIFENEKVLTLKEASEMFDVPVTWLRKQMGKPVLPGGKALRVVKFPADKNYYLFQSEIEIISKPRVFSTEYMEETRKKYEENPDEWTEEP